MKAIVYTEYGAPEVLHLAEVTQPAPAANELLVRVHAAAVDAGATNRICGVSGEGRWLKTGAGAVSVAGAAFVLDCACSISACLASAIAAACFLAACVL